ncbi:13422_t:CDS:2 [Cetraspora pellucida]|uniref:13422_t:CDS:1 n=1 Tax=Cetraspora pellucida TaxID=1433469 RepID=A0ACA9K2Q2_9GLOM|nr:13422_t:CDS:2 [Cetraspora pellucida]
MQHFIDETWDRNHGLTFYRVETKLSDLIVYNWICSQVMFFNRSVENDGFSKLRNLKYRSLEILHPEFG